MNIVKLKELKNSWIVAEDNADKAKDRYLDALEEMVKEQVAKND
jgi:hypothetical protein